MTDSYEMEQVHGWRERGRSWQTIAENLRRSTEDVRRRYDHSFIAYRPGENPREPKPLTFQRARTIDAKQQSELAVLALFYFDKGWVDLKSIQGRQREALRRLKATHGANVVQSTYGKGTRITETGRALYERLVQE